MNKIPFRWLSMSPDIPEKNYWDQTLIADILKDIRFTPWTDEKGSVVILPGAYQAEYIQEINTELNKLEWAVLLITSDEESKFPVEEIKHPNIRIYVQYPKRGRHDTYEKLPIGYTATTRQYLEFVDKDLDFFFSGQVTNKRREACVKQLEGMPNGLLNKTAGFSQGLETSEYMGYMNRAKTAPAPAGPVSADSFRMYEAMEAGAIPIGDNISDAGDKDFWNYLLGAVPFPELNEYKNLRLYISWNVELYPFQNNRVQAWWIKYKRDLKEKIINHVSELSGREYKKPITVIVPVSPIKSHPDTRILDETIISIRRQLPDAEIIITFDGVRAEEEHRRTDYEMFIRKALFKCNTEWNALPIIFEQHHHQVGMMRAIIDYIKSPTILYVEQDTPLTVVSDIDFSSCVDNILLGTANVIRFHFEAFIPKEHAHMMIGLPENGLQKTVQWSSRPHLASTIFYKKILSLCFSAGANCFIEDVLHGKLHNDYIEHGISGWNQWRVYIYHPNGSIKRSTTTDGREGEKKFDDAQVF